MAASLVQRHVGCLPGNGVGSDDQQHANHIVHHFRGGGNALFEDCEIRSLADARDIGYIAAPAHSLEQKEGFLFRNCRLTCEEAVTPGSIYLARPWRDYGLVSFENCSMDKHIAPAGFDKWNDTHRDKTARFYEIPAPEGRVSWINKEAATGR